ncbi:MAG TPA: thiamine phosphate synthase, partial [Candidatus Acidoferrum sp.]|nr:thiamine phosphate synthase [Candidatus Acidoferrum sp.]
TDRSGFRGDESTRRRLLLQKISDAALAGIDYIQLREQDLPAGQLESLAREAVAVLTKLRAENRQLRTALLINSRTDVALATGADGVHLRSDDISPQEVKAMWRKAEGAGAPIVGVSCHSREEVTQAAATGATFAVFAPVYEKKDASGIPPKGLSLLKEACKADIPVLALGGVTFENARACLEAGAAGVAGIRLFQENDISIIVRELQRFDQ